MTPRFIRALAFALLLAPAHAAHAQDEAPPAPAPGEAPAEAERTVQLNPAHLAANFWTGTVQLPGGMKLDFVVDFNDGPGGAGIARMDIPVQGMRREQLSDTKRTDTEMRFTLRPPQAPEQAWARFELAVDESGEKAEGTLKQFGQTFPVTMQKVREGEEVGPRRPQNPRPPFPYTEREVSFTNQQDSTRIVGTLTTPGKPPEGELLDFKRHPVVILISGSGAQDRDSTIFEHKPFWIIADHLARAGIATLRCDDRGVGGSTGSVVNSTTLDFAEDVRAAIQFLKLQRDIDPQRIALLGHSEGAMVAGEAAANSHDVAAVVLLAGPAVPGRELLPRQAGLLMAEAEVSAESIERVQEAMRAHLDLMEQNAPREEQLAAMLRVVTEQVAAGNPGDQGPTEEMIAQMAEQGLQQLETPWFRFFVLYDPRIALRRVRVPVLALFGERDAQVCPEQNLPEARAALQKASNPDATLRTLPDLNHLFQTATGPDPSNYAAIEETFAPRALVEIEVWLRRRLGL